MLFRSIGGPTGAFVVIVAGIILRHGLSGLLMVTMMAGVILIGLAVTGLGQAVKFIPRPVVLGFTNGIAVLIASTQIKDFFGMRMPDPPSDFPARMAALWHGLPRLTPQAVITFDACSSSISAISRCSRVAYSCRRLLASPSALWRVCSSSRAKLGKIGRAHV